MTEGEMMMTRKRTRIIITKRITTDESCPPRVRSALLTDPWLSSPGHADIHTRLLESSSTSACSHIPVTPSPKNFRGVVPHQCPHVPAAAVTHPLQQRVALAPRESPPPQDRATAEGRVYSSPGRPARGLLSSCSIPHQLCSKSHKGNLPARPPSPTSVAPYIVSHRIAHIAHHTTRARFSSAIPSFLLFSRK
ncbi:hypothetical protein B0H19DRAFT_1386607 [Mycena capillaripes]|nr:hypothetical protein B0H19DRAFT_1386607 [Mycena capillaripes]